MTITATRLPSRRLPSRRLPSTSAEAEAAIERLRIVRAVLAQHQADLDADVAGLTAERGALAEPLITEERRLVEEIHGYCEARRDELTAGGKRKSYRFAAGTVTWRIRPPSLRIADEKIVIHELRRRGRRDLIRVTETVDKDGLRLSNLVGELPGVTLVSGAEDFSVKTEVA